VTPARILVTGASGFVAGHLVPALRAAFPAAELALCGAGHGALDITDRAAVIQAVRRARPEACIHLAAISAIGAARQDPELAWRVNLMGTLHLAEAVRELGCLLVYASSAEIYGASFRAGVPLDETALPAPQNTYAATKAAADLALGALAADGLRVVRLRPFNHTGPGQTEAFVVPAFAAQAARIAAGLQPPVLKVGNLDARRDFLDVRDVCAAYVAAIARAETLPPGAILNIASGTSHRIGDILTALLRLAGIAPRIEPDPARMRPSDIPTASGDARLACAALGWTAAIPWQTTLRDVLADWSRRVTS
jgi:nucleoside-diphosphate-sugar epimerase